MSLTDITMAGHFMSKQHTTLFYSLNTSSTTILGVLAEMSVV